MYLTRGLEKADNDVSNSLDQMHACDPVFEVPSSSTALTPPFLIVPIDHRRRMWCMMQYPAMTADRFGDM